MLLHNHTHTHTTHLSGQPECTKEQVCSQEPKTETNLECIQTPEKSCEIVSKPTYDQVGVVNLCYSIYKCIYASRSA